MQTTRFGDNVAITLQLSHISRSILLKYDIQNLIHFYINYTSQFTVMRQQEHAIICDVNATDGQTVLHRRETVLQRR